MYLLVYRYLSDEAIFKVFQGLKKFKVFFCQKCLFSRLFFQKSEIQGFSRFFKVMGTLQLGTNQICSFARPLPGWLIWPSTRQHVTWCSVEWIPHDQRWPSMEVRTWGENYWRMSLSRVGFREVENPYKTLWKRWVLEIIFVMLSSKRHAIWWLAYVGVAKSF